MTTSDRRMRHFVEVARAGSLRAAADKSGLSQPALSKQIAALEATLGAPLFRRTGRGMALTPLGSQLLRGMADGYERVDAAYDAVAMAARWAGGRIGIASVKTLALYLLPDVIQALHHSHPHLSVSLATLSSTEVVERVQRGHADIGLVYDQAVDSGEFLVARLYQEQISAYVSRAEAERLQRASGGLSTQAVRAARLILPPRQYALRRFVERSFGPDLTVAIECDEISVSLALAAAGLGVAVLPRRLPPRMVQASGACLVPFADIDDRRWVVAIVRHGDHPSESRDVALQRIVACSQAFVGPDPADLPAGGDVPSPAGLQVPGGSQAERPALPRGRIRPRR